MRVGFLSFRVAGTDGVSLEALRWKTILERRGHLVTFVAGELGGKGELVPGLHFEYSEVKALHARLTRFGESFKNVRDEIFSQAKLVEDQLRPVLEKNKFDRLVVANVMSLPIHLSASVAINNLINEYKIPTISRNHDFWWERPRYCRADCKDYFLEYFVPKNELIEHVTINSIAQKKFKEISGYDSLVIGDCFDYKSNLFRQDEYSVGWRDAMGLSRNDIVFLQATRIVPRKRIELAIELVARLGDSNVILVLCGHSGDEGGEYLERLRHVARAFGIRMKYVGDKVGEERIMRNGVKIFTLWDCLRNCDLMTYPSELEGFGNQFIEGVYFKKPIFINRYPVYKADIEPLGFDTVAIDGVVTDEAVDEVRRLLKNPEKIKNITEKNFEIASREFSYEATQAKLADLGF